MIKFFKNCLEVIAWVNIVLSPTAILGFFGYLVYSNNQTSLGIIAFASLTIIGAAIGIYIAEWARKTIGCSTIVFRAFSSKDITKGSGT